MIGIIGAMDVEIDGFKELISDYKTETVSGIEYITGKINDKDIVLAMCGVGKVNAAICAQTMILKYSPDAIINSGVAGGLSKNLNTLDVAVATMVVQHDCDTTAIGEPLGLISRVNLVEIPCDENISKSLANAAKSLKKPFVECGIIATGDVFVNSIEQRNKIINNFGAIAAEMEGGAIGQVCYINNVPFGVLRTISDNAGGTSELSYFELKPIAADESIKIITKFIEEF